jgi:hypothetical protein
MKQVDKATGEMIQVQIPTTALKTYPLTFSAPPTGQAYPYFASNAYIGARGGYYGAMKKSAMLYS